MKIFTLGHIDARYLESAGGKARGLDRLLKEGFNVPSGFVLINIDKEQNFETAVKHYLNSGLKKVAVRSSATAEDGEGFSYAGQFTTVLNVEGAEAFTGAVEKCIQSLNAGPSKNYSETFGKKEIGMSIVVQEMVQPDYAGVCFTVDPNNHSNMIVEAVEGLGEGLVSGEKSAARYILPADSSLRNEADIKVLCEENKMLKSDVLNEILTQATHMKDAFQMPLDTEWAVKDGILYWLQARPITVLETCKTDEFDPKTDLSGCVITRCNIGEMLPGAVTPLTRSITLYAIDWGLRKMLCLAGANRKMKELEPYSCTFSSSGHLFFNLSKMYAMSKTACLAGKRDIDMSICGRILEEDDERLKLRKKVWLLKRLNNTRKYLAFMLSRKKALKQLDGFADMFTIKDGETAMDLYQAIDEAKEAADRVTYLHYITSSHSGAMSSAVIAILDKKFKDQEKSKAVLSEFLENIEGIESVDILASLRRVAKAVLEDNPDVIKYNSEELSFYMKTAGENVKKMRDEFLKRHGHRAIREAEMRNKSWADDEKAFIDYLKTVIAGGAKDTVKSPVPDLKALVKKYGFKGLKGKILKYLANQSREGVKNREYSKSKMIKVLDVFKKAYARLACMLVKEGKLPDEDAVYFLTHEELGKLAKEEGSHLTKKALQRRRLLKVQSELRFKEVYDKNPEPLPAVTLAEAGDTLKGAPVSRGVATGPARIVKSAEDAAKLQKGEIMVAAYTDIGWSPFYSVIEALVTEVGSALSHGAVVAREYALPLVTNISCATSLIHTGEYITVDGFTGCVTRCKEKIV